MSVLWERLVAGATEHPEKTMLVEAESGRALSYRQTLCGVYAIRQALGAAPRTVLAALPNGIAGAVLWLAALTGGHLLVPEAPDAPDAEHARLARRQRADVLVVEHAADAAAYERPSARMLTLAEVERLIANAPDEMEKVAHASARPGSACLFTSGSTGEPKGVVLDEPRIAWAARQVAEAHALTADDVGLTVLPFFHINAPVVSLCASLVASSTLVIARRFSRTRFWDEVERYRVTWASIVPTILAMLLQTERPAFLPGRLRFVRTASSALPAIHLRAFERRFGIPVIETYGLSEAASQVAANPLPPARHKPGSVGLPHGVELRVCRTGIGVAPSPLVDVEPGEIGEVCVRGPSVISGYTESADAAAFQRGWFRTGDLGYQDAEGYLFLTGRIRDVIIRGGENIAPREVEDVLLAAPGVREAAVVGVPDPLYGQQVVAYVVTDGTAGPALEAALRSYCVRHLSAHKVPSAILFVAELPRTRSGKLHRGTLRRDAAQLAAV